VASASPEALSALGAQTDSTRAAFVAAMDDDFNTAGALGSLFDLVRAINTARDSGADDALLKPAQDAIRELTGVLGLRLTEKTGSGGADKFIDLLLEVRAEVRKQKLWAVSDLIRDRLKEMGVTVEDSKEGSKWRYS
jgi:cysteinyl-tRNA synthetase